MVIAVEELVMKATKAPEPGGKVEVEQDKNTGLELTPGQLTSAGWVYIYDTRTGQPVLCNRNMLLQQLTKMENGKRIYSTEKPLFSKLKKGTFKCWLHQDNPERAHYDELGLPTCRKANLISSFQVTMHMMKKHKVEFATIKAEKEELEKAEERKLRERILNAPAPTVIIKNGRRKREQKS